MCKALQDLQREIEVGRVVAIIGVGVSVAATNKKSVASWGGLLHHGVDFCLEFKSSMGVDERWAKRVHDEIDSGDLDDMLSAAEKISRKLGAPNGGEYRRWLRETIGALKAERPDVLEALRDLNVALATTNYDGLIEEVTKLPAVTWMDGAKVERVLRGDDPRVVHLHGYWDRPESVVFGIRSYEQVVGNPHAETMQRTIRSLKTMLFVGCREGLRDPNFGSLLQWSAKVFAESEYRHFLLTRESEVAALQSQRLLGDRIVVLSYGKDFNDLAPFLRGLRARPGPRPRPQVQVFWIGVNGDVSSTWQNDNMDRGRWQEPFAIRPPNFVRGDSALAAISRNPRHEELFWIAADGDVSSIWRDDNMDGGRWQGPFAIRSPDSNRARAGSPLVAISRNRG